MAPKARRARFSQPRRRSAAPPNAAGHAADEATTEEQRPFSVDVLKRARQQADVPPALLRRQFYASLAWEADYSTILKLEASTCGTEVTELVAISDYARRTLRKGGAAAERLQERVSLRRNDIAGYISEFQLLASAPFRGFFS